MCPTGFHNDEWEEMEPTVACVVDDCRTICHAECSMKAFRDLAMFDHAGDEEEAKNGWGCLFRFVKGSTPAGANTFIYMSCISI